ncbi:hypothetical protein LR48_Vigan03g058200 [Vigna angularis]|uniref:Uncharacterized protein n=1 Tax=Phaseolus angularis TaxID=3914 RepID=A0A0L9U352_PHAAN|nr:hypothetical protein LR48_Vigan03g058200 [Vigna angularis]
MLLNTSYKNFKANFLKVVLLEAGHAYFYFLYNQPKFPFYWTNRPKKVISWPKSSMSLDEQELISQLNQIPLKSFSRKLIGFLDSKSLHNKVFDYLTVMDLTKSSTFTGMLTYLGGDLKKYGEGCSTRVPITPPHSKPVAQAQLVDPEVHTAASTLPAIVANKVEATHISSDPTQKKKNKRKAAKEPFPCPTSVAKGHFLKVLPSSAAEKKAATSTELQALQEKFGEGIKSNNELTLQLAEVENMAADDMAKAKTLLAESRTSVHQLRQSNDDLKLDLLRSTEKNKDLTSVRAQEWAAVPGSQATYLGNPVPRGTLPTIMVIELLAISFVEQQRSMEKDPEKKKYPGGAFDPLGYSKVAKAFQNLKGSEEKGKYSFG